MALTDFKIDSTDITSKGVVAAPDVMTGTAQNNKMVFDRLIREVVKDKISDFVDELMSASAAGQLGFDATEGINEDNIQDAIEYLYTSGEAGVAKAIEEALKSEGYAVGKQNGVEVESGTYFHNNSKYYSEQASNSATSASGSASTATTKATEASNSASTAEGHKTDAQSARDSAISAKNDAISAKILAETARSAAETAQRLAETAQAGAELAESNAEASATSASGSASSAAASAIEVLNTAVSYASAQSLTNEQKLQACTNIGAIQHVKTINGNVMEGEGNVSIVAGVYISDSEPTDASITTWMDTSADGYNPKDVGDLVAPLNTAVEPLINVWDEQWELGTIDDNTGYDAVSKTRIRSANHISVVPTRTYYVKNDLIVFGYDANKTPVSIGSGTLYKVITNTTYTIPSGVYYLRFYPSSGSYGTTYHNDISINYPSTYTGYYPSALPKTNAHVGGLGNAIGMKGWNQLVNIGSVSTQTINGITFTVDSSNNKITLNGTATANIFYHIAINQPIVGHKYFLNGCFQETDGLSVSYRYSQGGVTVIDDTTGNGVIGTATTTGNNASVLIRVSSGTTLSNLVVRPQLFDLTASGLDSVSTVADFRAMFPADYYPYCSGSFGDLLWTNSSPSSAFASQTISLDLTNYSSVLVTFKRKTDSVLYTDNIVKNNTNRDLCVCFDTTSTDISKRPVTVYSGGVAFDRGILNTTNNDSAMIPIAIYGIR